MSNSIYGTPNRPIKRKTPMAPTKNKIINNRQFTIIPFPSLDSIQIKKKVCRRLFNIIKKLKKL